MVVRCKPGATTYVFEVYTQFYTGKNVKMAPNLVLCLGPYIAMYQACHVCRDTDPHDKAMLTARFKGAAASKPEVAFKNARQEGADEDNSCQDETLQCIWHPDKHDRLYKASTPNRASHSVAQRYSLLT